MTPFRISVSLSSFFNDQRSLSYILIDNRFQTVEDLENHIKLTFRLKHDYDICLISNNHLLPSTEEINIIHKGDSLLVTPVNKDFYVKTKHKVSSNLVDGPTQPKMRKLSKKNQTTSVAIDDSSDEKDLLKIEPECGTAHSTKKRKKKKKSEQFTGFSANERYKNDVHDVIALEEPEQENATDNKNIHILNIENVSNMELDNINSKFEMKNTNTELFLCNLESSNSKPVLDIISKTSQKSKEDTMDVSEVKNSTNSNECSSSLSNNKSSKLKPVFNTISETTQIFKEDTMSVSEVKNSIKSGEYSNSFSNNESNRLKSVFDTNSEIVQKPNENSMNVCEVKNFAKNGEFLNSFNNNESSRSELVFDTNSETTQKSKEDCMNVSEVKRSECSNSFIQYLRSSNGGNGNKSFRKIPQFTVGDFLNYAHKLGHEQLDDNKLTRSQSFPTPDTAFITKRRRRVRKRKPRNKDESNSINSTSDVEYELRDPVKAESPLLHIRFDTEDQKQHLNRTKVNSSICTSTPNMTTKSDTGLTTNDLIKKTDVKENGINVQDKYDDFQIYFVNEDYFKNIVQTNSLENVKNTVLNSEIPPKYNDVIAFKLHELNEKYEPHISNWIVGKVVMWDSSSKNIDFSILAGHVQTDVPKGKFNPDDEDTEADNPINNNNQLSSTVHLNFMQLIDPRLLIIKN